MDQQKIGTFIATKRKEKKLTQEQLAEKLGLTNKAVSKWENGKYMPDVSIIQTLCELLGITVNELLNGEENSQSDEPVIHLLWLVKKLEKFRIIIIGLVVCNLPYVLESLWPMTPSESDRSSVVEFFRGFLGGAYTGVKIIGVCIFIYGIACYIRETMKKKNLSE